MKKNMDVSKFYHYAFPMQAVLVTCDDENGKTNPITIAWHTPISSKPPLYGISVHPNRYSHRLIEQSKEFVINFASYDIVEKVDFCGTRSGRSFDKIKDAGLTLGESEKVKTKYVKECFAHMECKLFKSFTIGDHTFFVGEIVNILSDENAFTDDLLNNEKVKPCYYIGDHVYTTIQDIKDKI
jgi:flavin reductase (DIM6/NTAB) family NADH-FMN oxidoreductase RutF